MNTYLVISALGKDRPGIVNDLSKAVLHYGGNITDSRMSVLGGEFALILMIAGTTNAIEDIERQLPSLGDQLGMTIIAKRTDQGAKTPGVLPYSLEVVAMDHPGIVHEVANFLSGRGINIESLETATYPAAHTGTPMFSLEMTIGIPASGAIAQFREAFMNFCDERNLDAVLRPVK